MIPDRLNMTSLKTKYAIDAARFQETGNPRRTGLLVGVEVLGLVRGLTHKPTPLPAHSGPELCCLRKTRCRILPVAVRGISSSRTIDTDRGRLKPAIRSLHQSMISSATGVSPSLGMITA